MLRRFLVGVAVPLVLVASGCAYVTRVSESSGPKVVGASTATGPSFGPDVSASGGIVVFESSAPDVVPNDANGASDVYARDRGTGAVEAVSVSSAGTFGGDNSYAPRVSSDGRFVLFESDAANLVVADTNGASDIFRHDRQTGATIRVSLGAAGAQANSGSYVASVSSDGRYVAFESDATNLVSGDTNARRDVFLRDVQAGTTTRVSVGAGGAQANGASGSARVGGNGSVVVFESDATNLVSGDTNATTDVFARDRSTGTTTRVSVRSAGAQAAGGGEEPDVSDTGRYVAFSSSDGAIVSGDTNGVEDVFVRDRQAGTTTRVSVTGAATQANGPSSTPAIGGDGRFVTFSSSAANLGATGGLEQTFRRDRTAAATTLVSRTAGGALAADDTFSPSVSDDGSVVAFDSFATNMVLGDRNGTSDVFVRAVATATTDVMSRYMTVLGNGRSSGDSTSFSADGRYVVFSSDASNLVPRDTDGVSDIFLRDLTTGATQVVSATSDGVPRGGIQGSVSADGRYVAFTSDYAGYVAGDTNGLRDVFVLDRTTGAMTRANISAFGTQMEGAGSYAANPRISADGRLVVFDSTSSSMVNGDQNGGLDVFLRDRTAGTTTAISVTPAGLPGGADSFGGSISADGRYVAFGSRGSNLVSGDTNGEFDTFVRDRTTGTTTLVSVSTAGTQGDGTTSGAISGDGRFVVMSSSATNLVVGDTNGVADVFVRDRQTSTTTRVSVGSAQANGESTSIGISADGRYVPFTSRATNLVSGDTNGVADVFVRDRTTGRTTRVSGSQDLVQANGASLDGGSFISSPAISADGRYLAYATVATNVVTPDGNGASDLVVRGNPVPTVSSVTPASGARGASVTVTVNGTNLLQGVSALFGTGVTVTGTNRVSESQVKFTVSIAANAPTGAQNVILWLPGTGAGTVTGAAAQFTFTVT